MSTALYYSLEVSHLLTAPSICISVTLPSYAVGLGMAAFGSLALLPTLLPQLLARLQQGLQRLAYTL